MSPLTVAVAISTSDLWAEVSTCLQSLPVRVVYEQAGVEDVASFVEKIERCAADVVILDVRTCGSVLPDLIQRIRACSSRPEVVALHVSSAPETILQTIRAGAREYIYPPCGPSLAEAMTRLSKDRRQAPQAVRPGGKIIGVVSAKGGQGATTIACHAISEIRRLSKADALIIDFDLSVGLVRSILKTTSRYSVLDACSNVQRLDKSFWRALVANGNHDFDVLGAPADEDSDTPPSAEQIRHMLRFVRTQYDWTIVDFGRGRSPALDAAIDELDELLVVTTQEVPALIRAMQMIEFVKSTRIAPQKVRVVINRLVKQPEVGIQDLERLLGVSVFATISNDYQSLQEAYSEGKMLSPDSPLLRQIGALITKLTGLGQTPQVPASKRFFSFLGAA